MAQQTRQTVIDPTHSFLVQAPAGSGKTELLTQRILVLLAHVNEPEEILALTFTRKAAAEMRSRVLGALMIPQPAADEAHRMHTWQLAQRVIRRDAEQGWQLLQNPNRLRIMTLDSLCGMLAKQMPLLSGIGRMPELTENVQPLYRKAAEQTLEQVQSQFPETVETLLLHQDHNTAAVIDMIAGMLENREQWLRPLLLHARELPSLRRQLETDLAAYISHLLAQCHSVFGPQMRQRLPALMQCAAEHGGPAEAAEIDQWPEAQADDLQQWKTISRFLLTSSGTLRKTVNKRNGFPPEVKAEKEEFLSLLSELESDAETLLCGIQALPDSAAFDEDQWRVLEALFFLLPNAVNLLQRIFRQTGKSDFTEIALRAIQALTDEQDRPTDLLLKLDYRIHHLLVDEFQDTSELQVRLLQCLTSGWQNDAAGRTLFLVGDPMQSIYRFRKAEVGLFIQAQQNACGLPDVGAESLLRNFRSDSSIIDWVNRAFARIFPPHNDIMDGAIRFSHAEAIHDMSGAVHVHTQSQRQDVAEARYVVDLVRQAKDRQHRVGILARSRKHLHAVMAALQQQEIPFRAIKIMPLHEQPEVRTLRALLRALLHPSDAVAWAALLRAPCCGLDTIELHTLLAENTAPPLCPPIWSILQNLPEPSPRIRRLLDALTPCMAVSGHIPVRQLVETAWHRLAMPTTLRPDQHANIETVLELIEQLDGDPVSGRIDFALFDEFLAQRFAEPDSRQEAAAVELLTMHGAKGLEWDTVILPGLGKAPRPSTPPLLAFTETSLHEQPMLMISPKSPAKTSDPLYQFIRSIEKTRDAHETRRLLYVACTRARHTLHLCGHVNSSGDAAASSLLGLILSQDEMAFGAEIHDMPCETAEITSGIRPLQRMRDVQANLPPKLPPASEESQVTEFVWSGPTATAVGHAVHAALESIGNQGIEQWQESDTRQMMDRMEWMLMGEGLSGSLLAQARQRASRALDNALASEHGRWILSAEHTDMHCEWALSHVANGQVRHNILDRSFIDAQGIRWIIDYKISEHEGGDTQAFINEEASRYARQLQTYHDLLAQLEPGRSIRKAIYFPLMDALYVYPE